MTRAQEILETICKTEPFNDNFGDGAYEKQEFDPEKLATYLAELEEKIEKIYDNCDCQP